MLLEDHFEAKLDVTTSFETSWVQGIQNTWKSKHTFGVSGEFWGAHWSVEGLARAS